MALSLSGQYVRSHGLQARDLELHLRRQQPLFIGYVRSIRPIIPSYWDRNIKVRCGIPLRKPLSSGGSVWDTRPWTAVINAVQRFGTITD